MNKHGVSRESFTENNVKHFKNGAIRAITNITYGKYNQEHGKLRKRITLQVHFKDVVHRYRKAF